MKNYQKKKIAVLYLYPMVKFFQLITNWKLAWVWGAGFPLGMGKPIWFCLFFGVLSSYLGWYLWRDPD